MGDTREQGLRYKGLERIPMDEALRPS